MKKLQRILIFVAAIAITRETAAQAQHEGHHTSVAPATAPRDPRCAEAGRKALALVRAIDTSSGRDATSRDAQRELTELQRAVSAAEAELFTCRAAVPTGTITPQPAEVMAGVNHPTIHMGTPAAGAKPAAPGTRPAGPAAKPADPMAGMDHSKMNMGTPAPGAKSAAPGTKAAARGVKPADPMAGMDHSRMNMGTPALGAKSAATGNKPAAGAAAPAPATPPRGVGKLPVMMAERIADPACPHTVGQANAPKAVFERKVYYFCSVAARDEFRKDPAAYLKKRPR
jgi:YHS domain-containing protein